MEAFSLLKYWRPSEPSNTAILTAASAHSSLSPYSSDEEDGPFFDLEFSLPDSETDEEIELPPKSPQNYENATPNIEDDDSEEEEEEEEEDIKISLSSNESIDQSSSISPSDELFVNGDLVSIEENPKFSLMKAKFRVLLLKLKKSKCTNGVNLEKPEKNEIPRHGHGFTLPSIEENEAQGKLRGKFMAVKLKVEEVPILSLFTRDTSSKDKGQKRNCQESEPSGPSDDRKLTKEVVQKYLKMVKPLYVRVSKRYTDKRSKGCAAPPPPSPTSEPPSAAEKRDEGVSEVRTVVKQGNNLQAGLKVMRKRLGKSRSSPAAVTAVPTPGKSTSDRRDDSLLQVQDGIQGAILHCKRSFNAARDGESSSSLASSSMLCRSTSDPSYEKSV